jgi:hypothetical protein
MELPFLHEWAVSNFEYPVSRETVIETVGDCRIEAPDSQSSETVTTVLNRGTESRFLSHTDLSDTIKCNLGDQYIGRKYYDDRGSNPLLAIESMRDRNQISF